MKRMVYENKKKQNLTLLYFHNKDILYVQESLVTVIV